MPHIITIEEVKDSFEILTKIYDSVRVIRPLKNKIIEFIDGKLTETDCDCYHFWTNGKACDNCVSMRAFNEKDTFFKLDRVANKIYMVIAIPIHDEAETIILELLKDVTNSMVVETPDVKKINSLMQTITDIGELQIRDSLTGLFNRRFIDERLPSDILNSHTDLMPVTIVFADIDRFKLINDTYGHVAGDYVLKGFAELLQKNVVGKDDWVARYGGEEFLIYLRNRDNVSAIEITEKIRKEIENSIFYYEGNSIKITSSFGVCSFHRAWESKVEELIEYVDKNLYEAKANGRNKIVASEI